MRTKMLGICPICDGHYNGLRIKSRHHIFPRLWYRSNLKCVACSDCHTKEFHYLYPMKKIWSQRQCILYWVEFCESKGKDAWDIYPQLNIWGDYILKR